MHNKLMPETQSGFRKNHSTITAVSHLVDDVIRAMDYSKATCLVLLDFSKAFDTLNHDMLRAKLNYFGFSEIALSFMSHYLAERKQAVVINANGYRKVSSFEELNTGVPQGSILGPLLFSLYVSDITGIITHSKIHQYADDLQLYNSFSMDDYQNTMNIINGDVENIFNYASSHNLKLNPLKSQVIFIGTSAMLKNISINQFNLTVNNQVIPVVTEAKNLGITLDSALGFDKHITNKLKSAYSRLKKMYWRTNKITLLFSIPCCMFCFTL